MKRFDTCFFERYARLTLMTLLGDEFAALVNRDRPDLQMEDGSLGIEVTRAMEPRKEAAVDMLKEMAGVEVPESEREEIGQIIKSGYAYGLYIFCKDDLSYEDVVMAMDYASDLQRHLDVKYSKIYLSLIDRLYVCDLTASDKFNNSAIDQPVCKPTCTSYPISLDMRRWFFMEALDKE